MQNPATDIPDHASDQCCDCATPQSETSGKTLTRGRCRNCYRRYVYALKKSGIFEPLSHPPVTERFLSRVRRESDGCHVWTGALNRVTGYGTITVDGKTEYAHRLAYTLLVGPIPEGMHVDHLCHNDDPGCPGEGLCLHRRCVNPEHLEPVTVQRNILRSPLSVAGRNAKKTHCKRDHEFTPENTIIRRNGCRVCRACHNAAQRAYGALRRARMKAA